MCNVTISFDRPWAFACLAALAFLIFFPFFRTPKNQRRSFGRIFALVAHTLIAGIATFLLAGPTFTETSFTPPATSIVLVMDASYSDEPLSDDLLNYACRVIDESGEKTEFAAVWFAGGCTGTDGFTSNREEAKGRLRGMDFSDVRYDATDIAEALDFAASLFPEDSRNYKRVILLSDGRETTGNAWAAAERLVSDGIRLDAVSFDVTGTDYAEAAITDFAVSPRQIIRQGNSLTLQTVIYSTIETEATLSFYDGSGETPVKTLRIPLNVGENQFSQVYTPDMADGALRETGMHCLRADLSFADPLSDSVSKNNRLYTWVKVNPTAKILLVDGDGHQSENLVPLLSDRYSVVDTCAPAAFPQTMRELLKYDEVALLNVDVSRLPAGADVMLSQYVSLVGRGLVTSAGDTTDSYFSYGETALEDLLPMTMTLDETDRNVAMMVVIDDSGSMVNSGIDRFKPAVEGAKKIVGVLSPTDYVGFVTFHENATVRQDLTKVEDPEALCELLDSLTCVASNTGTNYGDALDTVYDMLRDFKDAQSKHVIFLTDGEPTYDNYDALPGYMKDYGITLTTVSLLASNRAMNMLAQMAQDGGGEFYPITDASDLSSLSTLMEDLAKNLKEPQFVNEEPFAPKVGDASTGILTDVDATKLRLNGYIASTKKDGAVMALFNDDFRPIVAEWQYGAGYVTSFLSNFGSTWCEELYTADGGYGQQLIRNLFDQSLNELVDCTSLKVTSAQDDRTANIRVETAFRLPGQTMELYVSTDGVLRVEELDGSMEDPLTLRKHSSGVFGGSFETQEPNRLYYLTAILRDAEGTLLDYTYLGYSGGVIAEYQIFSQDGDALLKSICDLSGGAVMTEVADLLSVVPPDTLERKTSGFLPCVIAIGVFLLADILARTVTFSRKEKKKE